MLFADKLRQSRHCPKQGVRLYLTPIARKMRKLEESLSSACATREECVEPCGRYSRINSGNPDTFRSCELVSILQW